MKEVEGEYVEKLAMRMRDKREAEGKGLNVLCWYWYNSSLREYGDLREGLRDVSLKM